MRRRRLGVGRVAPGGHGVQQLEHPLGPGHRGQRLVVQVAEHGDGVEKQVGEEQELHQRADLDVAGQRLGAPHRQQGGDEQLPVELQHRQEDRRVADHLHVVARVHVDQLAEQAAVDVLAHVALGDLHPGHRFGQGGGHLRVALVHGAVGALQLAAEVGDQAPEQGDQRQHHQEQDTVVVDHQRGGADHRAELDHPGEHHVLHAHPDGVDVGDGPADEAPHPPGAGLEVAHRHAQEVLVDPVAQVVHHRLAELQREAHPEVEVDLRGHGQREKTRGAQPGAPRVLVGDGARQDRPHQPAQRGQLDGAQEHQAEQDVALEGERAGHRQQPADQARVQRPPVDLRLVRIRRGRAGRIALALADALGCGGPRRRLLRGTAHASPPAMAEMGMGAVAACPARVGTASTTSWLMARR